MTPDAQVEARQTVCKCREHDLRREQGAVALPT